MEKWFLKNINFQPNVRKELFWGSRFEHSRKSIIVKLILYDGRSMILEAENKLLMSAEDIDTFHSMEPTLIQTLEEINPKYGVERVRNISKTD